MAMNIAGASYAQVNPKANDLNYIALPMYGLTDVQPIGVAAWIPKVSVEARSRTQRAEMRGLRATPEKGQGADVEYDAIEEQGGKIEIHLTYAQGIQWSREFGQDADSMRLLPSYLVELGRCAAERMRIIFCAVLNDAFAGATYTTNAATGGLALLSASHVVQGGTASNLITGDLGVDTLETAWVRLMNEVDYRGKFIGRAPKYLTTAPAGYPLAVQLLAAGGQPDSALNATNFMAGRATPISEPVLADTDAWFLSHEGHTIHVNEREAPTPLPFYVDRNGTSSAGLVFRTSTGLDNRYGIVGSAGV